MLWVQELIILQFIQCKQFGTKAFLADQYRAHNKYRQSRVCGVHKHMQLFRCIRSNNVKREHQMQPSPRPNASQGLIHSIRQIRSPRNKANRSPRNQQLAKLGKKRSGKSFILFPFFKPISNPQQNHFKRSETELFLTFLYSQAKNPQLPASQDLQIRLFR